MEKIKQLLRTVRSRNFAYKATKQKYHKELRDKALKELRAEIWAYKNDKTIVLKLVA
jgi:hypothetical protein